MKKWILPLTIACSLTLIGCESVPSKTTTVQPDNTVEATIDTSNETETSNEVTEENTVEEEKENEKSLDEIVAEAKNSTGLTIEVSNSPIWDIVQIYGDSEADFDKMKEAFISISLGIDESLSEEELSQMFDENIGEEGGLDAPGLLERAIFSAPNEEESWYRVDIYTKAFLEE